MFVKKRKCLEGCYFGLLTKSLIYFSLFFRFIFFFSFVLFSNLTFAGRWFSLWFSPTDWDLVDGGRGVSGLGEGEGLVSGHILLMTEWRVFLPLNHSVRLGFVICTLAFLCNFTYVSQSVDSLFPTAISVLPIYLFRMQIASHLVSVSTRFNTLFHQILIVLSHWVKVIK